MVHIGFPVIDELCSFCAVGKLPNETRRFLRLVAGDAADPDAGYFNCWEMADPVSPLSAPIRLFVCGDVMPGRGIDQILSLRCAPQLHEPYVRDARRYVDLVEKTNGAIRRPAGFDYIWGDALAVLNQSAPDARIINLETSITESNAY